MKKLLICDDEKPIRLLMKEVFSDYYAITEAADGREVLEKINTHPYDLLIIDIKMPRTHGLDVIKLVRRKNLTLPIIICSAYQLLQTDDVVTSSDVAAFFPKPVNIEKLKNKVIELIGI
jgi:YesN/AraC family two-component response regulator